MASGPDLNDLSPDFLNKLNALIAEVRRQGGSPQVTSGFRTTQQQAALYDSGNNGVPVAKPGSSLHEKGLAADVTGDAKTVQLLHSLAGNYGLSFPMANDPVHVQMENAADASASGGGTSDVSNQSGPMPLSARLGIVMSMLGATPTAQTEMQPTAVGQVDTSQTQLATQASPAGLPQQGEQLDSGNPAGDAGKTNELHGANQTLGQKLAGAYGWSDGDQWESLNRVIASESGWQDVANPNSNARGIGQKITGYDDGYQQGNAQQQIEWTLNYIKHRYGSPEAAWQHKLATRSQDNPSGWY